MVIDGGRERIIILIDALDEAKEGEGNPLVEMLARHAPQLPEWLCFVVTSRPEKNVTDPLQGLNPYILDTESESNKNDICTYIELELHEYLINRSDSMSLVKQILEKSEGVFIYAERVCQDVKKGFLSLDHIEDFPKGLGNIYSQFFKRQFPDEELYRVNIQPALRAILAAQEAFPLQLLGKLFNWNREEQNDFTRLSGSLFPVLPQEGQMVIKPYHKSIIDWITEESTAGKFFISVEEGHKILADFGWKQFWKVPEIMDLYFIKWLPRHLLKLEKWDELTDLLCNLGYIQEKTAAKLTYHLADDFNQALQFIPDNAEYIRRENEQKARMDKYGRDLITYAGGEISGLEIPESLPLWSSDKIDTEIERMQKDPTRQDRLKEFKNFLGQEAGNLQKYSHLFPHFATQQAWNYADVGPVGRSAEMGTHGIYESLLLRSDSTRPQFNPIPLALKTMKGHTGWINSVTITPDGRLAVSGSSDCTCILWDMTTGEAIQVLKGHTSSVHSISVTPDHRWAISGSYDNSCIMWDLTTGEALKTLKGHSRWVNAVSITPDGKRAISGSQDKTCILWDLTTGEVLQTLKGHTKTVFAVSITPDGLQAVSGSEDKTCILWDLQKGEAIRTMKGHSSWIYSISITPDGKRAITGSEDRTCILWDLNKGDPIHFLKGHTYSVFAVSITPDGKLGISGSEDKTCILWDMDTGKALHTLNGHSDYVTGVSITPDGTLAISGSADNTCILWDLTKGKEHKNSKEHTGLVMGVSVTADGKRAISCSSDKMCILWDLTSGKALKILKGHSSYVTAVSIAPDSQVAVSGSADNTCILWDMATGEIIRTLKGHTGWVHAVSFSPDGRRAVTGSYDNTCILWDLVTGKALLTLKGHEASVRTISISTDGKRAISGSIDKTLILWDMTSGMPLKVLKRHTHYITSVSISPDGKRGISGSDDKTCILWDLITGEAIQILEGHNDIVTTLFFTPDGQRVISGSEDNTCTLWDLEKGEQVALFVSGSSINAVSSFPGGIFGGESSGKTFILKADKELLCRGRGIVTIKNIWDFKKHRYMSLTAGCPLCGHRFAPPAAVLTTIETITKTAGLKSRQSPCLELPKEVWDDPGLLSNCPECGRGLKFNPFIAGGDNK
jgi:WD40 repeat protein